MSRPCPICSRPLVDAAYQPFCSRRCADVDLQRWLSGGYVVRDAGEDADEDGAPRPGRSDHED